MPAIDIAGKQLHLVKIKKRKKKIFVFSRDQYKLLLEKFRVVSKLKKNKKQQSII